MEKSIESIWKEGFFKETSVDIPKVNNLYNRKSIHLMDKLLRTLEIDLWSIVPVAIVITAGLVYQSGTLWIGLVTISACTALFFVGKAKVDQLKQLDKSSSCFHYLREVKKWIAQTVSYYTRLMAVGGPLFVLTVHLIILLTLPEGHQLTTVYERLGNSGTLWFIGLSMIATAFIVVAVYRLAVKLVYGPTLKKIEMMLEDLEVLRDEH
ncbi:MAG: hypothetical protein AAFO69_11465 [Bacteroidota bacterium]